MPIYMAKNNKSRGVNARKKKSLENFTNIYVQIKGLEQESCLMRASVHSTGAFQPPAWNATCFKQVSHAYSNHVHKTRPHYVYNIHFSDGGDKRSAE